MVAAGGAARWIVAAGVAVALTSCGSQASAPATSPRATTTVGVQAGAPTASPVVNCKLPVYTESPGGLQGAWLALPGGQLSQDSSGTFNRAGGDVKTTAQPTLTGLGIAYYDRPAGRWIPASRQQVADDASQYAYADAPPGQGQVHLVEVASARDRVISIPASQPSEAWSVLEFTGGKIYLVRYGSEGPGTPGLWSLDPGSGQVHQVFSDQTPAALQGSTAWFQNTNPADGQAITDARTGEKLPDQIMRRDLGTGATTPWFYRPGYWAQLMGVDSTGHPFVALSKSQEAGSTATLWFVAAPNLGRQIFQGTVLDTGALAFNITDKNGTWFGGTNAVYLYRDGGNLTQVSSSGARPAGRCA